ncbi:hypothetical protein C7M84_004891 [Penaeus vannamei]|uniref:Uncharacterized protein n=1 Tax=Penaeus vannamei TaxID=6689 RepID=A0A3R7N3R5_PENVA|nr:hypothetical protein C7M84_004891 [Penaeus vannamei]
MSAQLLHPGVEASKMLEAALQQMDGIIAGTQLELASLPDRSVSPVATISELAEKLRLALQSSQDDGDFEDVDDETKKFLLEWLKKRTADDVSTALFETVCRGRRQHDSGARPNGGGRGGGGVLSLSLAPCILGFFGRSPSLPLPPSRKKKGKRPTRFVDTYRLGRTRGHVFGLRSASQVGLPAPVTSCQRSEAGGLVVPKSALKAFTSEGERESCW